MGMLVRSCRLTPPLVALAALLAITLPGACSRPKGVETEGRLSAQIEQYGREPSDALAARIDASFARLDADIAELRADAQSKTGEDRAEDDARIEQLSERRTALRKEYYAARVEAAAEAAKGAAKKLGESLGKSLEEAGQKLQEAARGEGAKD